MCIRHIAAHNVQCHYITLVHWGFPWCRVVWLVCMFGCVCIYRVTWFTFFKWTISLVQFVCVFLCRCDLVNFARKSWCFPLFRAHLTQIMGFSGEEKVGKIEISYNFIWVRRTSTINARKNKNLEKKNSWNFFWSNFERKKNVNFMNE